MLVLHRNLCCNPSFTLSHGYGSDEGSKDMVSMRNKKNYPSIMINYSFYLELCLMIMSHFHHSPIIRHGFDILNSKSEIMHIRKLKFNHRYPKININIGHL